MSLSRKFAKVAGAGLLSLAMLAGAGCTPPTPAQQKVAAEEDKGVYTEACIVVDRSPDPATFANTYDFRNGVVIFRTSIFGAPYETAFAVPVNSLNETGKAHAMDMYNKLPADAKCEAPKMGPK